MDNLQVFFSPFPKEKWQRERAVGGSEGEGQMGKDDSSRLLSECIKYWNIRIYLQIFLTKIFTFVFTNNINFCIPSILGL